MKVGKVWLFKQKAGALRSVDLDEISGVDDPANLTKGWVLMKSSDDGAASRAVPSITDQLPNPVKTTKGMDELDLAIAAALNGHRITLT